MAQEGQILLYLHENAQCGLSLENYYPDNYKGCLLITVTETKTLSQLDKYVQVTQKLEK